MLIVLLALLNQRTSFTLQLMVDGSSTCNKQNAGVAPRAKMNQQRQRRYRAATELASKIAILKSKQKVIDSFSSLNCKEGIDLFDSNAITAGSEFMSKMSEYIKFFVQQKLATDPLWKSLTTGVLYSGPEVLLIFIILIVRLQVKESIKLVNTFVVLSLKKNMMETQGIFIYPIVLMDSHCIYGLDADLIMLSLATHEPHFVLLREKVVFRSRKENGNAEVDMFDSFA